MVYSKVVPAGKDWKLEDLEASLKRAFVDNIADYIIMDGHQMRNEFLRDAIAYGLEKGWLHRSKDIDEDESLGKGFGQYFAYTYRLTDEGKKHFAIDK